MPEYLLSLRCFTFLFSFLSFFSPSLCFLYGDARSLVQRYSETAELFRDNGVQRGDNVTQMPG